MPPEDVLRAIAAARGEAICVPTMTTAPAWRRIAPDDLSVTCVGFMGGASAMGLGLAMVSNQSGVGRGYFDMDAVERVNARAEGVLREDRVHPRRLGHVLIVSPDSEATIRFFTHGVGFKVSDYAGFTGNAFMR